MRMIKSARGVWASPWCPQQQSPSQSCQLGGWFMNLSLLPFVSQGPSCEPQHLAGAWLCEMRLISDQLCKWHSHSIIQKLSAGAGGTHTVLSLCCEERRENKQSQSSLCWPGLREEV